MTDPTPPTVQPQPTPFVLGFGEARGADGTLLVMIDIHTVTGRVRLFTTPEESVAGALEWLAAARKSKTGLVIPAGVADLAAVADIARRVGNGLAPG